MKTNYEIAVEVIQGKWGNYPERQQRLEEAGYDYDAVQEIVNQIFDGTIPEEPKTPLEVTVDLSKHDKLILNLVM